MQSQLCCRTWAGPHLPPSCRDILSYRGGKNVKFMWKCYYTPYLSHFVICCLATIRQPGHVHNRSGPSSPRCGLCCFLSWRGQMAVKNATCFPGAYQEFMSKARKRSQGSIFFPLSHCFQLNWQEIGVLYLSLLGAKLIQFHFSDVSAATRSCGRFRSPQNQCILDLHKWHLSTGKESDLHGEFWDQLFCKSPHRMFLN